MRSSGSSAGALRPDHSCRGGGGGAEQNAMAAVLGVGRRQLRGSKQAAAAGSACTAAAFPSVVIALCRLPPPIMRQIWMPVMCTRCI
eukprot:SAG31_NODE_425_length_15822_cov_10.580758_3_plen_87_part_00